MQIQQALETALKPYLPVHKAARPFVTLTYAQLLDSKIAAQPGTRTRISHEQTKHMTHYIRHHHEAILVGVGTVLADDPKLNCRYGTRSSIRPVVVDPSAKWSYSTSQLKQVVDSNEGLAPFILIDCNTIPNDAEIGIVESDGGKYLKIPFVGHSTGEVWNSVYSCLATQQIDSVMIEGGATVINDLLVLGMYDTLIITIGPVFLGANGVSVTPNSPIDDLENITWWTGIQDSVMMAQQRFDN